MVHTYQADVAVIGGGIAGVVCALELLRAGKSVVVLEREGEARFGGSALEAFGGLFFVDSPEQRRMKITDTPEQAYADWKSFAAFEAGEIWPQIWAKHLIERSTPDGHDWLKTFGIRWLPVVLWVERGQKLQGNSVPRFHLTWGTSRHLITRLIGALQEHLKAGRLKLCFGHRVDRFETQNGRVWGCSGVINGSEGFRATAEAVVVASGGIGGDLSEIRRLWSPGEDLKVPETILLGTHPGSDGRVVTAAGQAGARVTNVGRMWNYAAGIRHPRPQWEGHGVSLVPPKSALWTDAHGKRLMPPMVSGFDTYDLVQRVCAAPLGFTWQILNRRMALKELAASGADWNPALRERKLLRFVLDMLVGNRWIVDDLSKHCPDVVVAPTVEELAAKMNAMAPTAAIDAVALKAEIERFDATLDKPAAADEQRMLIEDLRGYRGDKMRLAKAQRVLDPKGGPLMAMREHVVTRKSLGGIVTDLRSRALNAADQPIAGLYAVGEAAGFGGGGSHGYRALEGTFLLSCVITARRAAESIAKG
ncbi:MAG: FAD-binding dehydrogenase [Alphaproteobacteria bacterium]|nr:FAD-binding dehydrogenase [Alphaproteobacteria bacterium]